MSCSQGIPPNPDVAGIGVRLSIYIQVFLPLIPLLVALVITKGKPALTLDYEATVTVSSNVSPLLTLGCGLLLSAIIQAKTVGLSVYHAILVLDLNWLIAFTSLTIIMFTTLMAWSIAIAAGGPQKRPSVALAQHLVHWIMIHLSLTCAFGIWLFSTLETFDASGCTTDTVHTIFGQQIQVSIPGYKKFWLVVYSLGVIPPLNLLLLSLLFLFIAGVPVFVVSPLVVALRGSDTSNPTTVRTWPLSGNSRERTQNSLSITVILMLTIAKIIVMTSIEQTIGDNHVQIGEAQWTLGQGLAMFLVLPGFRKAWTDSLAVIKRGFWRKERLSWAPERYDQELIERTVRNIARMLKNESYTVRSMSANSLVDLSHSDGVRKVLLETDILESLATILEDDLSEWIRPSSPSGFALRVLSTLADYDDCREAILAHKVLTPLVRTPRCISDIKGVSGGLILQKLSLNDNFGAVIPRSEVIACITSLLGDEPRWYKPPMLSAIYNASGAMLVTIFARYEEIRTDILGTNALDSLISMLSPADEQLEARKSAVTALIILCEYDDSREAIRRSEIIFKILEKMLRKSEDWGVALLIKLSQYENTLWEILNSLKPTSLQATLKNNATLTEEQRECLVALFQVFEVEHGQAPPSQPLADETTEVQDQSLGG